MKDIAALTGATTSLKVGDKDIAVKPLTIAEFGQLYDEMVRGRMVYAPRLEDAIKSIPAGSSRTFIADVIESVAKARAAMVEPGFDELLAWIENNPLNMIKAVCLCVDDESVSEAEISREVMKQSMKGGSDFLHRWAVLSGMDSEKNPENSDS